MRKSRRKTNNLNAGFTLIEVVLSIAILAIVSLPILSYFTDSMRYSSMMSRQQKATFLAQEITEGILAENMLVVQDDTTDDDGNPVVVYRVPFMDRENFEVFREEDGDSEEEDEEKDLKFEDGSELFTKTTDDGYVVDVAITHNGVLGKVLNSTDYGIDSQTDVIYIDSSENDQAVFELTEIHNTYVFNQNTEPGNAAAVEPEDISDNMSRRMYVELRVEGDKYRVRIFYEYTCPAGHMEDDEPCSWGNDRLLMDKTLEDLQNIYLIYNWCSGGDTVIIKAMDLNAESFLSENKPGLHIICQNADGSSMPTDPYKLDVKVVNESGASLGVILPGYTNLDYGLYAGNFNPSGTETPDSDTETPEGAKLSALVYTIETKVYRDEEREDPLAEITATKGEWP